MEEVVDMQSKEKKFLSVTLNAFNPPPSTHTHTDFSTLQNERLPYSGPMNFIAGCYGNELPCSTPLVLTCWRPKQTAGRHL